MPSRTVLGRAFILASVAWVAVLPLAPLAVAAPPRGFRYAFAFVVYGLGSTVCHQLPDRSFFIGGATWAVCARCAGIYAGGAIGGLMTAASRRLTSIAGHRSGLFGFESLALVAAWAPTAATLAYEWTTGVTPSNLVRALAGLPAGVVVGWIVIRATSSPAAMR